MSSSAAERFFAYAAAFEKAYASDDWSRVEPYFHDDAVYDSGMGAPLGGRLEGRAAILAYFKRVLDRFDRRFESRELALLDGPRTTGDSVWIRGRATYRAAGVPHVIKILSKIPADPAALNNERDNIVSTIRERKLRERRELFEEGLVKSLTDDGKIKIYDDAVKRLIASYGT